MKSRIWPWIVFGGLALSLCYGCAALGAPPVDANHDGIIDQSFVDYVAAAKGTISGVTGGVFDNWLSILEKVAIAGLGIYAFVTKKSIAATDKNVATVAEHAKVPEEKLI